MLHSTAQISDISIAIHSNSIVRKGFTIGLRIPLLNLNE